MATHIAPTPVSEMKAPDAPRKVKKPSRTAQSAEIESLSGIYDTCVGMHVQNEARASIEALADESQMNTHYHALARAFLDAHGYTDVLQSPCLRLYWSLSLSRSRRDDPLVLVGVHLQRHPPGFANGCVIGRETRVHTSTTGPGEPSTSLAGPPSLPDFVSMASSGAMHAAYRYVPGSPSRVDVRHLCERGTSRWVAELMNAWLRLHDARYLEDAYELQMCPSRSAVPVISTSPEVVFAHGLGSPLPIGLVSPVVGSISGPQCLGIRHEPTRGYAIEFPHCLSPMVQGPASDNVRPRLTAEEARNRFIGGYLVALQEGFLFVAPEYYATEDEAVEALFRLKECLAHRVVRRVV